MSTWQITFSTLGIKNVGYLHSYLSAWLQQQQHAYVTPIVGCLLPLGVGDKMYFNVTETRGKENRKEYLVSAEFSDRPKWKHKDTFCTSLQLMCNNVILLFEADKHSCE